MPRKWAVEQRMTEKHLGELRTYALRPSITVNDVHAMTQELGYSISRSACRNYVRHIKRFGGHSFGVDDVRRRLVALAANLSDHSVTALVSIAAGLKDMEDVAAKTLTHARQPVSVLGLSDRTAGWRDQPE
jgi:hypothetical protein